MGLLNVFVDRLIFQLWVAGAARIGEYIGLISAWKSLIFDKILKGSLLRSDFFEKGDTKLT